MKIQMISGCTLDSLTVDGVEERELTDDQRKQVLQKMFDSILPCDLSTVLPSLLEIYGVYENCGRCKQCGDDVETYTWEI